ncbi:MAG: glycosyltransferase family 2 protein [Burkholderiales bacterium]|nr:glycosyltransferase family 2 protein [Burkholderiales bacterium]
MPDAPPVSVVIPAYNAGRFVLEAIAGARQQEYPSLEIIVVDDGSSDGTADLVARHAPDVRLIRQVNAGAAAARNTGMRHATGELLCFLDADDGWLPGKLAAQVVYLMAHPEVGAVFHRWLVLRPGVDGTFAAPRQPALPAPGTIEAASSGWIYSRLLLDCIVHTSTIMIRRQVAHSVGGFDTTLATGEDYDYWLRLSRQCEIHKLAGTYSFYRETAGGLTSAPKAQNNEYRVVENAVRQWGRAGPDGTQASQAQVSRRLGKLSFDFGHAHYHAGSPRLARTAFAQALRHDPTRWRAAAYFLASNLKALSTPG